MEFFILWIMTRIKEQGWPKTRGLLRRRRVISEDAVVAAMEDAVRVGITIGGSFPDIARAIAITFMEEGQATTRKDVDRWIDSASNMGDNKVSALADVHPQWRRFCSITASKGDIVQHFLWSPGGDEYDLDTSEGTNLVNTAVALAGIAMCWALRHQDKAQDLFYDPEGIKALETELQELDGKLRSEGDFQELAGARSIYAGWLHMAETLVSRYSQAVGFQKYEDLP